MNKISTQILLLWMALASFLIMTLSRLYIQAMLKRNFAVSSSNKWTGAKAAKAMLKHFSMNNIEITPLEGSYNDIYVHSLHVLMISTRAWSSTQIVAIARLLFETAKAVQYKRSYGQLFAMRRLLFKLFQILSYISILAIVILAIFGEFELLGYPTAIFTSSFILSVLFLPLDFATVGLAKKGIDSIGIFNEEESKIAFTALYASALTYVASSFDAILNILKITNIFKTLFKKQYKHSKELI